jgi:O-antigen ligase
LALSFAILCVAGLISRVAPDLWHTAPSIADHRLSYPLTYWNALGISAALGIVLGLHLTCAVDEPWPVRVLAAALVPLECTTLYFTFSRGAMASCAIGVIVYMIAARPRALLSGLVAVVPVSAVAVKVAYDASLLASSTPTTPAAIAQAHRVALALGIAACVASLLRAVLCRWLDPIDVTGTTWGRVSRRTRIALVSLVALVVVGILLVVVAPKSLADEWHQFLNGAATPTMDMRQRLINLSSDGRTQLWRVAINAFDAKPLDGYGAGTYQLLWQRSEPVYAYTVNAHSLYFETMAELGLLGLVPLVCLVLVVLFGLFRRCRGDMRPVYAALAATALVSLVHAGVDWDWQMPATMLGVVAAAGLALSPTGGSARSWIPGRRARKLLGIGCIAAAVLPIMIMGSQARLHRAQLALVSGHCDAASSSALSAIGWMPDRPEPYELLGYCDLQRGFSRLGMEAMQEAINHDPSNWEGYYSLALAQASAGLDPRVSARRALQMNPKDPLTIQAARAFAATSPSGWPRVSSSLRSAALASGELSVEPT